MTAYGQDNIRFPPKWIAFNLNKRECNTYIQMPGGESICQCGRRKVDHGDFVKFNSNADKWSPLHHTRAFPTDAYGSILFEGEHHHNKAHYARLSYDSNPELVLHLLRYVWGLPMPKLVISIHGGSVNFELSAKLAKSFQNGITKVARTTSAWVFSNGLNSGVAKHLGNALNARPTGGSKRKHVMSVGIAPWGMCEHRNELIGRNKDRVYSPLEIHNSNMIHLNPRHSNFLLVDNGSIGKFGGETFLRKKLEKCISAYSINLKGTNTKCTIPVIVIIMEGGGHTMRLISEYLYDDPPVPIIILAGTGKVTDLIAWTLKRFPTEAELQASRDEVMVKTGRIFYLNPQASAEVFQELKRIYRRKYMITIYNGNSAGEEEFDTVILSSVLRSPHWSPLEQLELTLVWNKVDLAQNEVFVYGREWSKGQLEEAMMVALVSNRLEFVELLMEHGINMKSFLTVDRLEKLYNKTESSKFMGSLLMEFSDIKPTPKRKHNLKSHEEINLSLLGIGAALIQMGIYRAEYIEIRARMIKEMNGASNVDEEMIREHTFPQPFDDLFLWAVLTKRQELAKLLWTHGIGSLAKALVATSINKFLANEVERINISLAKEFEKNMDEWSKLSLALLDSCYREDLKTTRKLLTMELTSWSKQNCLTLAEMADIKPLLGHPCCQIVFGDLWMGSLNVKSNTMLKIGIAAIFPPLYFILEYKPREQLQAFPTDENEDENDGAAQTLKGNIQDNVVVPESESTAPFNYKNKWATLRSRYKVARKTDLAEVVSKLDFWSKRDGLEPSRFPIKAPAKESQSRNRTPFANDKEHTSPSFYRRDNISNSRYKMDSADRDEKFAARYITTQQKLKFHQKLYASQKSPVANFIRHFFAYLVFLVCLWYVILFNQDPHSIGWVELYVTLFVFTQGLDCIRECVTIEGLTFAKKLEEIGENGWRVADFFLCPFFLMGTILRLTGGYFQEAMVMYRASSIYWNLRLYKYLATHRFIGPKLLMLNRMFGHMAYFTIVILVVILSFALARDAIRSPHADPVWEDIKPAFLEPYIMIFGEMPTLEEAIRVQCIDYITTPSEECPLGAFLIPVIWVVYMMIANILIINVLIAIFNGIYTQIDSNSVEIWMSQQFVVIMEFVTKPLLPPPFIIICHVGLLIKFIYAKCNRYLACSDERLEQNEDEHEIHVSSGNDHSLMIFLDPAEQEIVFDFEEENLDLIRHLLSTDKDGKPIPQTSISSTETPHRAGAASEKGSSLQDIKNSLQELYTEMENQRVKIDKLTQYWELEVANLKERKQDDMGEDDDDYISSSDYDEDDDDISIT